MPHMVIFYTANLERETNMSVLCRNLADTMLTITDEENKSVFPKGGTRVLAFPAPHFAIADGGAAGHLEIQGTTPSFTSMSEWEKVDLAKHTRKWATH